MDIQPPNSYDNKDAKDSRFPETLWTRVRRAHNPQDPNAAYKAFDQLCRDYWSPLYAYARAVSLSAEDAQRFVNELFYRMAWELFPIHHPELGTPNIPDEQKPIGKQRDNGNNTPLLERAEEFYAKNRERHGPHAGKLREFFMLQLKTIAHSDWRSQTRRTMGFEVFTLDDVSKVECELRDDFKATQTQDTPEAIFMRHWKQSLLQRAQQALKNDMEKNGEQERFRILWPLIEKADDRGMTSEDAGRILGMSDSNVRVTIKRIRAKLRNHILRQIAETLDSDDPKVLEDEVRALFTTDGNL